MKLSEDIAFVLHEQWRQTRLEKDGSYEPRWKIIKDTDFISKIEGENLTSFIRKGVDLPSYIRKIENHYEMDIANAYYTQLSADWQNENKAAAEVVAKILESDKKLSRNKIGEIIHNAWLERNTWAIGGELDVPFEKLPKSEQYKDMVQYDVALTMIQAKVEKKYMSTVEEVAEFLGQAKKNGQNIVYDVNGENLYSEFDTPDTCSVKVNGGTDEDLRLYGEYLEKEDEKRRVKAIASIPEWQKRGESLIYPEKKNLWYKVVEDSAASLYHGLDIVNALDIMEALEEGKTEEATKLAEHVGCSDGLGIIMINTVTFFSKRGPEFHRTINKDISSKTEEFLQKLESENRNNESMLKDDKHVLEN